MNNSIEIERFFGFPIAKMSFSDTVDYIIDSVEGGKKLLQSDINVAKLVYAKEDANLSNAIQKAGLISIDGVGALIGARFLGISIVEKVSGCDLFFSLLSRASSHGISVYFLGAKPEILELMLDKLTSEYPNLKIVGYHHGYFDDDKVIVDDINKCRPDMLFLGMPSPAKECFLANHLDNLHIFFGMGVGGSFDVAAGVVRRAPKWVRKSGLEWSFRLFQEPKRLWKRYLYTNTLFIYMVLKEKLNIIRGV